MKDFSMFEYALKAARNSVSADLGEVSTIARRIVNEYPTLRFRTQGPCLEYLGLLIENALLLHTHRAGRVYAGFEKLSHMEVIFDRYLRIADVSERVHVFGEVDWQPPRHPNMRIIAVAPNSSMSRECFLIADSPTVRAALVAVDEEGLDVPLLEARTFRAFKSHDPAVVAQLAAAAEALIDQSLAA